MVPRKNINFNHQHVKVIAVKVKVVAVKVVAVKVVAVVDYMKNDLTRKKLVIWKNGCLEEVVAHGDGQNI